MSEEEKKTPGGEETEQQPPKKTRREKKEERRKKAALIWRFLRGSKAFFVISILSAGVSALADMLNPQIIRVALDNVIPGISDGMPRWAELLAEHMGGLDRLKRDLWILALGVVLCALIKVLSQYLFRVFNTKGSETLVKTMRDTLYTHIQRLPYGWHMKNKTGDIIQRCTSDIDTMKNFVSEQMTSIFRILLMVLLSVTFMFSMNLKLTLVALFPLPIIFAYSLRFHSRIGSGFEKCDESEGRLSAMAQENLTGVRVVRAFGRERYEKDRFEAHNEEYTGLWVRLARVMSAYWSTADILSGIQIMLLVVLGSVMAIRGSLTSGEYIAFISYNSMLIWPVRQLGRMISEMSKAGVSIDRIMHITDAEEERDLPGAADADMTGDIAFEHVCFGYEGCPEILHDVNFTVKSGTTLGILGGTGSGKSTLMLLLDKLYDIPEGSGRITVGGVDLRQIRTEHLRRNVGFVLQEPYLFSRSLGENIGITDPEITDEGIREAARAACLDETAAGFADGYDTMVGERGVTLSGGQKQRAAIARNLVRHTPVMIYDDSLSAVDTETDAKIRAELERRFGSATIFIISHRITTLSHADRIVVLDGGRVAQIGTHAELSAAEGIYRQVYLAQSGLAEEEENEAADGKNGEEAAR